MSSTAFKSQLQKIKIQAEEQIANEIEQLNVDSFYRL